MPSKTGKQARAMAAASKSPAAAKRIGIPQKVAREFHTADKRAGSKSKLTGKRGK